MTECPKCGMPMDDFSSMCVDCMPDEEIIFYMTKKTIEEINFLSNEALTYTLSQPRDSNEAIEMQGYLRGMRDALFSLGVCSETQVYDDLIKATYYITNRSICDTPTNE